MYIYIYTYTCSTCLVGHSPFNTPLPRLNGWPLQVGSQGDGSAQLVCKSEADQAGKMAEQSQCFFLEILDQWIQHYIHPTKTAFPPFFDPQIPTFQQEEVMKIVKSMAMEPLKLTIPKCLGRLGCPGRSSSPWGDG